MAPKQRMRVASEKHSQNVNTRGSVPKSLVRMSVRLLTQEECMNPVCVMESECVYLCKRSCILIWECANTDLLEVRVLDYSTFVIVVLVNEHVSFVVILFSYRNPKMIRVPLDPIYWPSLSSLFVVQVSMYYIVTVQLSVPSQSSFLAKGYKCVFKVLLPFLTVLKLPTYY